MNRLDQDRLLADLVASDTLAAAREASLGGALRTLRAQQRRRRIVAGTLSSLTLLVTALVVATRSGEPEPAAAPAAAAAPVKVITDEQLLALFADRNVALVGAPGRQELVFLDSPPASRR